MKNLLTARLRSALYSTRLMLGIPVVVATSFLLTPPAPLHAAVAPTIIGVAPNSGLKSGGDSITITGTNFDSAATVKIGATAAASTTWIDSTTLTAVTPAGVAGARDVTVTNSDGQQAMLAKAFTYTEPTPTISSVSPAKGPAGGGQSVTITGQNFTPGWKEISQITSSANHSCGIYDGQAYCWGVNTYGQLGNNTRNTSSVPVAVDTSGVLAGKTIISIAAGLSHTCAVTSDNQTYCWGYNNYGQLGNNSTTTSYKPVAVDTAGVLASKTVLSITTGSYHTCVVASDNQAYCWGYNYYGALGNNSTTQSNAPVAVTTTGVLSGKTVTSLTTGDYHTCAVASDNLAYCWGFNSYGQLGNNSTAQSTVPVAVVTTGVLNGKTVSSITAGATHTCVVTSDNLPYCWGYNAQGQLGNNSTTQSTVPVAVVTTGVLNGKTVSSITAGTNHACAIASDNQAYCWGYNAQGQLGNNSTTQSTVPVAVVTTGVLNGKTVSSIAAGLSHTCAVTSDNQTYCWGYNNYGQLGNNSFTGSSVAVAVQQISIRMPIVKFGTAMATNVQVISNTSLSVVSPAVNAGIVSVSVTSYDNQTATLSSAYTFEAGPQASSVTPTAGIISGGDTITITGTNFTTGSTVLIANVAATSVTVVDSMTLTAVTPAGVAGARDIKVVSADGQQTVLSAGFLYRDLAPVISSVAPAKGPAGGGQSVTITGQNFTPGWKEISQITSGTNHSCGIYDSQAYCWGINTYGQLGNNTRNTSSVPVAVDTSGVLSGKTILSIEAGDGHTCAIASDSLAYCWGYNTYGQLGNNSVVVSYKPVAVVTTGALTGKTISSITAGGNHTCAIASDNQAYCWGYNTQGQLGNNSTNQSNVPVAVTATGVLAGKTVSSITTGANHTCVVASDNLAYCWGFNSYGQLGNNSTAQSAVPVAVDTYGSIAGKAIVSIAAGASHTCVVASDNQAYCWGDGGSGQLGNNSTSTSSVPVAVVTTGVLNGKTVSSITTGANHTCVVASDNLAYCWGYNPYGQLGNNSSSTSSVPVAVVTTGVLAGKKISSLTGGGNYTCAIASDNQAYCWGYNIYGQLGDGSLTNRLTAVNVQMIKKRDVIIQLGGVAATAVNQQSSTSLTVTTPAHIPGIVTVTATLYDDQSASLINAYEFANGPSITSVSPGDTFTTGGDTVTISGSNFLAGSKVRLDDIYVSDTTIINTTSLTFVVPARALSGSVDVTVEDSFGQAATLTNAFTYHDPTPVISSISPNQGPVGGSQSVTITGQNFTVGVQEVSNVSSGANHSCGIYDSQAYCWGINTYGQLGNNSTNASSVPVAVDTSGVLAGKTILSIEAGDGQTCAIASDNQAYCWGYNAQGQLGINSTTTSYKPVAVTTTGVLAGKTISSITTGGNHTCAIASDNQAYCWGYNAQGQLGNNSTTTSSAPVAVATTGVLNGKTVSSITTGANHTCVVASDNLAYCWGFNTYGQLGNNSTAQSAVPVAVDTYGSIAGKTISSIAAGASHTCVVASDNQAHCWGDGGSGQLGNNSTTTSSVPVAAVTTGVLNGKTVSSITTGANHTCVVASDNLAYCWGYNPYGQLGNNSTTRSAVPVAVTASGVLAGKKISSLTGGGNYTCASTIDKQAYCWGYNIYGQLGDNTTTNSSVAVATRQVPVGNPTVTIGGSFATNIQVTSSTSLIATTPSHSAGLVDVSVVRYDGLSGTQSNAYEFMVGPTITGVAPATGQTIGGDTITITGSGFSDNVTVTFNKVAASALTRINDSTLTVTTPASTAGTRDVIVHNSDGQTAVAPAAFTYLEPNPTITSITPNAGSATGGQAVTITGQNFSNGAKEVSQIVSGATHSCGIYDGQAYCWGLNNYGQLGNNSTNASSVPVAVGASGVLAGKTILSIETGDYHTCVIASDNQAYCWGYNAQGQLGNNSMNNSSVPVAVVTTGVLAGKTILSIAVGDYHTCVVASDNQTYCWGNNAQGQLGNNSTGQSTVPVATTTTGALAGKTVISITAGTNHTCAIASDNQAYCWGYNGYGQLGNNSTTQSTVPVAVVTTGVLNGKTVSSITAGANHTCVVASDNLPYCWGYNAQGQLGNNSTTQSSVPVAVVTTGVLNGKTVSSITAGTNHTCAIASDNQAYCWGYNGNGQLGNNSTTQSTTPAAVDTSGVLAGKTVSQITAGGNYTCAIASDYQAYCWGINTNGQLGNNSKTDASTPVAASIVTVRAIAVLFDNQAATNVQLQSPTTITAVAPAHTAGTVDVAVNRYDNKTTVLAASYTYVGTPTIASVSPNTGSIEGGNTVTVNGTNFHDGIRVKVGGIYAASVTLISDTSLSFVVPEGVVPGSVDVMLEDTFGKTATLTAGYTYQLPTQTITSITPTIGSMSGGTRVTITGTGFAAKSDGGTWYSVTFGGTQATAVTYINDTTLQATTPAHALGVVDVSVTSAYTNAATLTSAFTYTAAAYVFSNAPLTVAATEPGKLTIQARNDSGNPVTSPVDTTIDVTSSSTGASFARNLSEDESTRWSYSSVVIPAGKSSVDIWYKDTKQGTPTITGVVQGGATFTQSATVNPPYKLKVTGVSDPIQAGTPSSVTVQVVDYAGASLAGYTGTISFSSTDLAAGLPAEYTMTSADRGIKTFVNGVTMGTTGEFCVTATDTTQSSITGQQCNISVASANAGTITKLAIISPTQNFPLGASSSAITIQAQGADSSPIPVSTATTIYVYANSTTGEFSSDQTTWSGTKPFAITIPAGQTAANVYYRDTAARTTTISARDMTSDTADAKSGDYGWVNATQDIVSGTGAAANLVITGKPTLLINEHGRYTIELQDSGGNAVTASSDTVVRIGSSSATTSFYLPNAPTTALSGTVDVTIPGGSMRTTVDMSDSVASSGTTMNTLTVVDGRANTETARLIDGSAAIQIVAAYPANIVTTTSAPSTEAGSPLAMTVQLTDANGVAAPATSDMTVALSSSSKSGQFSLSDSPFTPITSLQFARGVSSATLYYRDTLVGSANLQASQSGLQTTGAPVEVTSSAPVKFGVIGDAKVPLDTSSNAFTVTSYDIYGNVAIQNNSTPVYLYSDQSSTQFASSTSGPWTASSVTIAPGQSSAQFYLKDNTFHVNQITASDTAPLDQPDTGMVNGTQQVTITSQVIASVVVTSAAQSIVAGQASQAIDIALRQADGSPALQDGTTDISLTATEGHFIATQNLNDPTINSKVVTRGTATTSFYFTGEKAGSHTMTVSASPTARATQPITITAAETASMDFISGAQSVKSGAASSPLRINFNDTYGNNTTSGSDRTIALSSTCAAGTFSESDTNWLATSTIAVAAASTDATFYYKDTSAGTCTISVTTNNLTSASQPITITATAPTRLSITGSLQSMIKGQPRSLAINLLDASGNIVPAETQTVVYLQTSSSGGKFDQASVTFESGTSTRTVTYTDTVAGQATITARDQADPTDAEGSLTDTAVTVDYSNGTPSVIAFGAPTSTMKAGDTQALTLSLRNEYNEPTTTASPLTLTLNSTNTSGAFLDSAATDANTITTLTIPAGEGAAALYYHQTQSSSATVTASAQGLKSGAATLTILPDSVHEARFTNSSYVGSNALEIGQSGALTATLYDIYGNVATTGGDVTLYAQSDAPSGSFSDNGQMTIPAAGSSATIQYTQDLAGRYTITADDTPTPSDTQGLRSFTQTGEVINGAPSSFQFDRSSLSLERGGVTDATQVTLLNAHGRIVAAPSGGQTVQLSMLTGTGTFSTAPNGSFSSTLDLKVEAGKTSAQFYYRNDNAQIETRDCTPVVDDSRTCTTSTTNSHRILGAVTTDDTSSSKALTAIMSYGAPTRFAFTTPSRQHEANRPSPIMTVERQNQYGKPVPLHSNTTLYLRSSAQSGQFGSSKIKWGVNTVTILDSNASVSFYYKDGGTGTPTITAADTLPLSPDLNIVNATQTATILPATSTPPPVASFHVTNISDPQKQGTHSSAVVLPLDADGYVVNSYSGTISFTSSDSDAILPDTYTFNPEVDMGSKTFTNEIAFATAGEKTVTVTDGDGKTGSQTDITVTDGNTSAVSAIALTQPASPVTIIRNAASQNITFELHDTDGQPTNAPIGGMPVRLTSSAPTGKFALKPGGPWVSNLVVTVPAGLSFGNFYYMDSQLGKVILSATDWAGAADSTAVANGKLEAVIQSIGIDGDSIVMSRNVFGVLEPSKYLFAHDAAGSIQGQIHNIFNSLNLETNTTTPVSWRTQLRQGVKLLLTNSMSDTSSASIQKDDTTTVAGQPDFYATAEATDTTFDNPDEVVSRQYTIPTSPWKASISSVSPLAMQPNLAFASNAFNDITAAMVSFYQRNALTAPSTAVIKLLNANATDASQPIYTWGATSPNSTVAFTVPANLIANDTAYRIFVATFDSDGYTTAQALSAPLTLRQTATLPPTITGPPATNDPMPNNESPAIKNGDDTTSVTPTTDLANKQPDEIVQNRPNKVKGTPHSAAGALPSAAIAAGDFNLESQIAATYIGTTVVLVLLLREAYKEIARIRRNRAIIRREQQLAADRDTFLALSGHYLRTPISILDAAASMAPAAQQSLRPIINTLNEKANTLLQSSTQRIAAETAPVPTMRHAYLSVFFWLPILLSIGLSYAVVSLLAAASAGTAPDDFQVYTGIILAALALAAFFGTRVIYINNEREKMSRILQKHQEELFQAKNVFMAGMRNEIAMELRALHEIKAQQILPAQIAALIDDGVQRLDSLVAKIGLATQISTMPTTPEQFTAEQLIHPLVQQRSAAIEDKKLRLIQRHTPAILVQDKRLLGYVINALIDNAIKFNRTNGRIEITTQTHKRGRQLIVTITNTTNALVDTSANMENLFKPFNHTLQGDDLTADGAGLSLYLDKIIVEHMGGSIKAERSSAYETSISFIIPVKREE